MKYYLAIDIGASSGRHIVGWLEDGKLKTQEVYRFKNGADSRGGHLIWDTERLFAEVVNGLKAAGEQGYIPESIGIDTWAVDYALLDKNDKKIGDMYAYRDSRTIKATESVHRIISFDELYKRTGIQFQTFNTIYQLYADKMSGKTDKAESLLMLPDYLNFLLTGVKKQEYTNATSTGLVNAETHTWDGNILELLGFDKKLFGELSQPGTVVGELKEEIAKEVGYNTTVILPATHDTASAVEGIPFEEDAPYISSGTWSLLGVKVPKALTDKNSCKANYSNEGGVGYYRYQKNVMGMWLVNRLRDELCPEKSFTEIVAGAEQSEYSEVCDVNAAEFLSPESMKAAFDNTLRNKPESWQDYFRCAYLSLARSYKLAIEELEINTGRSYDKLYIVGGGAKNAFLNGLTAKETKKEIIALPIEASAIGNIKIQIGSQKFTYPRG